MQITSVDHFNSTLESLLKRAQKNLVEDDDLRSTALVFSHTRQSEHSAGEVSADEMRPFLLSLVKAKSEYIEYVVYISLGIIKREDTVSGSKPEVRDTVDTHRLCVFVEGSHQKWGYYTIAAPFVREAPRRFEFAEQIRGTVQDGGMLSNLWPPPRKLNS